MDELRKIIISFKSNGISLSTLLRIVKEMYRVK